ncbi:MAG: hypothetical protein ABI831_01125 [Betaproteobacteria bacterium]
MRSIACITAALAVREILGHPGEPTSPPRLAKARGPPLWQMPDAAAATRQIDPQVQPEPDYQFDQRRAW